MGGVLQTQGTARAKARRQGEQWAFGHGWWDSAGEAAEGDDSQAGEAVCRVQAGQLLRVLYRGMMRWTPLCSDVDEARLEAGTPKRLRQWPRQGAKSGLLAGISGGSLALLHRGARGLEEPRAPTASSQFPLRRCCTHSEHFLRRRG